MNYNSLFKEPHYSELRTEEVQDILTRPPRWLLRWGITVVFIILIIIVTSSWLIHYPDLVRATFRLTSANNPKALLPRVDGKVVQLFVQEGELVKTGATLAYLESTASHSDVLELWIELVKAWELAKHGNLEGLARLDLASYNQLGELQNSYQVFEQAHIQLRAYLANGFYGTKKKILQQEITDLQALSKNLNNQYQIQARDVTLAEEDFEIQRQLARDKVIAPLDLKREESKVISRKLPYQQTASALINNLTAQRNKQREILELDKQVTEERDKFLQAITTLQSEVAAWKLKYILASPMNGRVYFSGIIQENQFVTTNQELFYIAPPNTSYFGELHILQQNAGKVHIGQHVIVKFAGYPYQEFGAVQGQIATIADVPLKDSTFLAKVILPAGLKTTYGKQLTFRMGMTATADIITDDSRLIEKIFYELRKLTGGRPIHLSI